MHCCPAHPHSGASEGNGSEGMQSAMCTDSPHSHSGLHNSTPVTPLRRAGRRASQFGRARRAGATRCCARRLRRLLTRPWSNRARSWGACHLLPSSLGWLVIWVRSNQQLAKCQQCDGRKVPIFLFLLHQCQTIRSSRQAPCVARADVPEEKAANIALGTVASKARTALIDACAAYREQDSQVTPSLIPV